MCMWCRFVLRGALRLFRERRVRLATVEAAPYMWRTPHDPALAAAFRDVLLAGYRARCMSHPAVRVSADSIVAQLGKDGALAKCVDLIICRDDDSASAQARAAVRWCTIAPPRSL